MTTVPDPKSGPKRTVSWWDVLWLLALSVYIAAGIGSVPFHGDEAMQITMSHDYFTAFINNQPQALTVTPPYNVDTPNWLRLINGSVNLYTVGLSLHLAGYTDSNLPPIWVWPMSYDDNVAHGDLPAQGVLTVSRISSAVFLALSASVLFGIGWQFKGRWPAYIASGLYAINPVVLVNGRRAMMEGSVLCFGLLAILIAILICKVHRGWRWWIALGVAGGLTFASKHSGIIFVGAAFGWIGIEALRQLINSQKRNIVLQTILCGTISFIISILLFIALSPAQWNNPIARLGDLVDERAKLLDSQVKAEPTAPTPISDRVSGIFTQPYMQAPVYFEAAFWGGAKAITDEINTYDSSPISGLHTGNLLGGLLTLLALIGIVVTVRAWRTWQIGLLLWLAITVASLLINPLPWQRYYLAEYPVAVLLTALGATAVIHWINQRRSST